MNHVPAPDRELPPPLLSTFPNDDGYDQLIVALAIPFTGLCGPHTMPVPGTAHIGYLPADLMLSGATLGGLVECFAARPQSQADFTRQIAAHLDTYLRPHGVGVLVEAEHNGPASNHVRAAGPTSITSALLGTVRTVPSCRREFFALIRRSRLRSDMERGSSGTQRSQDRTLVFATAGLIVVVVAFFSSYASALGNPSAHHLPVAVTAPPAVIAKLAASPALTVHAVPDLASAQRMVEDRSVSGALVLPRTGPATLLVASGGGHAVAVILRQLGQQAARARGAPLKTYDVAPTSHNDPNGTVEFYCIAFLMLGAALGATVLGRILGPVRARLEARRRLGWVLLYSGLLSLIVTVFADVVFGALVGHFALLFLTLWLFVAAVGLAVTGAATRLGVAASLALILVLIALGNPSSGGAVPRPLLNGFYSGLNPVLPQGAALSALRGVQYFGNHGTGPAVLCLAIWAAAGLALLASAGLGWPRDRASRQSAAR